MMSRRTSVIKLCRSFAKMSRTQKLLPKSSCVYHYCLPSTSANMFSVFARRCEGMKIVSDKFDDDSDNRDFDFGESDDARHINSSSFRFNDRSVRSNKSRSRAEDDAIDFDFGPGVSGSDHHTEDHGYNRHSEFSGDDHLQPRQWGRPKSSYHERPQHFDQNDDYRSQSSHYNQRPSRRWEERPASFRSTGESRAAHLRNSFGRSDGFQPRQSMEDLWGRVKHRKTNFDTTTLKKNFYREHSDVTNRPQEEVQKFTDTHQITVTGQSKKRPIFHFAEAGFPDEIVQMLRSSEFKQPTPIQSIAWPHALSGSDIVGIAQTGSGKTLSFLLPAMLHIQSQRNSTKGDGPYALVMCPTRELANQCHHTVRNFSKFFRTRSVPVYGGQSKYVQEQNLAQPGLDLVIATPGRLMDFLSTEVITLDQCSFVVLDEADRMLDMGFEPQIRAIMSQVRPDRQVLMWSATWPDEIQDLASDFLKDYVHVKIGSQMHAVNADITQEFEFCDNYSKMEFLLEHFKKTTDPNTGKPAKTLVFCTTKSQCSRVQGMLFRKNVYADVINGDKSQMHRDRAMYNFRTGRSTVLVASDVAARGIDVNDIQYVVNYDLPNNIDGYIHRIGRTGRAGKKGTAISYITTADFDMIKPIVKVLDDVEQEVPDILYRLLQKRDSLKSYRRMDRSTGRMDWQSDRRQQQRQSSNKYFRY